MSDNIMGQHMTFEYDEFNRLTSWLNGSGQTLYTYGYDRYGNRTLQNSSSWSYTTANNRITGTGYTYDAAGNMTQDGPTGLGFHTYTYDAEGNIIKVDTGTTAQYTYNALNHRVKTVVGSTSTEFVFNAAGQRVSVWNGATQAQLRGQYYWGSTPVAYYVPGAAVHFQHQDYIRTERLRTSASGAVEQTLSSLRFGDGKSTESGDPYFFASLDSDSESGTDHAQYRQYSNVQGRWLRPDPYLGSYDSSNPQSTNRYSYVLNNPLAFTDPMGLDDDPCGGSTPVVAVAHGGFHHAVSADEPCNTPVPDPGPPDFAPPPNPCDQDNTGCVFTDLPPIQDPDPDPIRNICR